MPKQVWSKKTKQIVLDHSDLKPKEIKKLLRPFYRTERQITNLKYEFKRKKQT